MLSFVLYPSIIVNSYIQVHLNIGMKVFDLIDKLQLKNLRNISDRKEVLQSELLSSIHAILLPFIFKYIRILGWKLLKAFNWKVAAKKLNKYFCVKRRRLKLYVLSNIHDILLPYIHIQEHYKIISLLKAPPFLLKATKSYLSCC